MAPPPVYIVAVLSVVAVGIAFHRFVYEPHIAPAVEAWAENYVQKRRERRQRQQQGPIFAHPAEEHGNENVSRRSVDDANEQGSNGNGRSISIELEEFATRELWRQTINSSGLRRRQPGHGPDESNIDTLHPVMSPTHVISNATPPSPGGQSFDASSLSSLDNSPARPTILLSEPLSPAPRSLARPPRVMSPRLPTPMSDYSPLSSRVTTPTSTLSEHSSISSRRSTPDVNAPPALISAYSTPLAGSMLGEHGHVSSAMHSVSGSRVQSPFSDINAAEARSAGHVSTAQLPFASPRVRSPSISSDVTLDSDDDFDVMSPRSGIFTPQSRPDDDPFEVLSQHGSDVSWASVGRRSPSGQ